MVHKTSPSQPHFSVATPLPPTDLQCATRPPNVHPFLILAYKKHARLSKTKKPERVANGYACYKRRYSVLTRILGDIISEVACLVDVT